MNKFLGKILGYGESSEVESPEIALTAPWTESSGGAWVFFGCLALVLISLLFYFRWQSGKKPAVRIALAVTRASLLCLLLLILAEPVLKFKKTEEVKPALWLVFDCTKSMGIRDQLSDSVRNRYVKAIGGKAVAEGDQSRVEWLSALLSKPDDNLLQVLSEKYELSVFKFSRDDGVDQIFESTEGEDQKVDVAKVAASLDPSGRVTAIGAALDALVGQSGKSTLQGIVLFSDFGQNSGTPAEEAATRIGVPIYTVGIGPDDVKDLGLSLQAPLLMKKAEKSTLAINLRQNGLDNENVTVKVVATPVNADGSPGSGARQVVQEKVVKLTDAVTTLDVTYTPEIAGRFMISAEVAPRDGEVVTDNNRAEREVTIQDDFLRLLYVEYEPTWEWRFIKEVFYRDKLVGERGFRTFLRSADPKVRHSNDLFLQTLTPARSEFFQNDVIFLGDMPASTLSSRFCEMVKEFVGRFGGGLVIISGPRFGPAQLLSTPIGDMLPVIPEQNSRPRAKREFRPRLTEDAASIPFMQLGDSPQEHLRAWNNLGFVPWYHGALRARPLSTVLLEHPSEVCASDGQTPQPLIAIRRYGKGEVIYLGFNETWRMRRKYGELYYRQFWGQMIHRLGLSHALGSQKRFVVNTDRQSYQEEDRVLLTVEAYNKDFEAIDEKALPPGGLLAQHISPGGDTDEVWVSNLRDGVFETEVQVFEEGDHILKVRDPETGEFNEVTFRVAATSAELRSGKRNRSLQDKLAVSTGGRSYEFDTVNSIATEIKPRPTQLVEMKIRTLWNTWPVFILVVLLMLGEWLFRKLVNLP